MQLAILSASLPACSDSAGHQVQAAQWEELESTAFDVGAKAGASNCPIHLDNRPLPCSRSNAPLRIEGPLASLYSYGPAFAEIHGVHCRYDFCFSQEGNRFVLRSGVVDAAAVVRAQRIFIVRAKDEVGFILQMRGASPESATFSLIARGPAGKSELYHRTLNLMRSKN
jgi:hypothetical protein